MDIIWKWRSRVFSSLIQDHLSQEGELFSWCKRKLQDKLLRQHETRICVHLHGERNAAQDSATIKYALSRLSINVSVIGTLKSRFVQSNIKTSRRNPATLAAHKSVTPVCLPYISNLSFVVSRARKLRKLFLPMHTTTASCIFGALYGRHRQNEVLRVHWLRIRDRHTLLPTLC